LFDELESLTAYSIEDRVPDFQRCLKAPRKGRKKQQTFRYQYSFTIPLQTHCVVQKAKLKLGKAKRAPSNVIDTSFKARCASFISPHMAEFPTLK
jgi:hypothetical protein